MSDILPTGFTSIDLQQGGTTAFSGLVSGVEGGPVIEPLQYMDHPVYGTENIESDVFGSAADIYHNLHSHFKPWTLDWIDIRLQIPSSPTPTGNTFTIGFFKQSVGDDKGDIVVGDRIGAEITIDPTVGGNQALHSIRCNLSNLSEAARRFEPGETLTVAFGYNDTTMTVTEIQISWLGRTRTV